MTHAAGGRPTARTSNRAQSHVVGIAVLLGVTMLSLGALTAGIGAMVERGAAAASADRVAADLDASLRPVESTGPNRGRLTFADGQLRRVERTVRVLNESGVVAAEPVGGLVFTAGRYRVAYAAGSIVRGTGSGARLYTPPPFATGEGVVVVGVVALNATGPKAVGGGETSLALRTNVTHSRRVLGEGTYRIAVETAVPSAWEAYFERSGARVERRDFDDDGVPSVVGAYAGDRVAYLVVHDLRLKVGR
jgi:hypothetical protein